MSTENKAPEVQAPAPMAALDQDAIDCVINDADMWFRIESAEGPFIKMLQAAAFIPAKTDAPEQTGDYVLWETLRHMWQGAYHANQKGAKPVPWGATFPQACQVAWSRRVAAMKGAGLEGAKPAAPGGDAVAKREQRAKLEERKTALMADITPPKAPDAPADAPAPKPTVEAIQNKAQALVKQAGEIITKDPKQAAELTRDALTLQREAESRAKEAAREAEQKGKRAIAMAIDGLKKATEGMDLGQLTVLAELALRIKLGAKMTKNGKGTISIEEPAKAPV